MPSSFVLHLIAGLVLAQPATPVAVPPPPIKQNGTAPLLYAKFIGPPGMEVTYYRGTNQGAVGVAPSLVGLRPGYVYRMEISKLAGHPGVSLYPTVEVIGTLRLPARISARKYPAPVVINEQDIEQVLNGAMVTKLVYLEHPDFASTDFYSPDAPPELPVSCAHDLLAQGHERGRPVMIVRLGQRSFTPDQMAHESAPGTILFPHETYLPPPGHPPVLAPITWPWADPFTGPKKPEEEYLYNGCINPNRDSRSPCATGDCQRSPNRGGLPGIDGDGNVGQLRPEDTVAEYTDCKGCRKLVVSNRVCLVVPRYAILRVEQPLIEYAAVTAPQGAKCVKEQQLMELRQPVNQAINKLIVKGLVGRSRPSGVIGKTVVVPLTSLHILDAQKINVGPGEALCTKQMVQLNLVDRLRLQRQVEFALSLSQSQRSGSTHTVTGPEVVARVENGPEIIRAVAETREFTAICLKEEPCPPDRPLVLIKWSDRECTQVGDVVPFFLKYTNVGGKPLTDVAISDSLTTRLEYVPGSAQSNRPAVFTTQLNDAGSSILRWEITGKLLPGESGIVRFQAKVR